MKTNYVVCLLLINSFLFCSAKADENFDVDVKLHCENTKKCEEAANICGYLAGIQFGSQVCQSTEKKDPPHPDYIWQREVKIRHCMGALPIIATMGDNLLYGTFLRAYNQAYSYAHSVAGCN